PNAEVTVVEESARMIGVAQRRMKAMALDGTRVEFICRDIRRWSGPAGAFDTIITQFFLDCFTADDVGAIVGQLGRVARPHAHWLLADFHLPPLGWRRTRARA